MKSKGESEKDILKKILHDLEVYKEQGHILWYLRVVTGLIQSSGMYMKLSSAGNPDIISVIKKRNNSLGILFLEVKREGVTRLRYEQRQFFTEMEAHEHVYCEIINNPGNLWPLIERIQNA